MRRFLALYIALTLGCADTCSAAFRFVSQPAPFIARFIRGAIISVPPDPFLQDLAAKFDLPTGFSNGVPRIFPDLEEMAGARATEADYSLAEMLLVPEMSPVGAGTPHMPIVGLGLDSEPVSVPGSEPRRDSPRAQLAAFTQNANPAQAAARGFDANPRAQEGAEAAVLAHAPGPQPIGLLPPSSRDGNTGASPPTTSLPAIAQQPSPAPNPRPYEFRSAFRSALKWGVALTVLAPIVYGAAPPLMALYTGLVAMALMGVFLGLVSQIPSLSQGPPNLVGIAAFFGLGFFLGLVLPGAIPGPELILHTLAFAGLNIFIAALSFWMAAKMLQWATAAIEKIFSLFHITKDLSPAYKRILSDPGFQVMVFLAGIVLGLATGSLPEVFSGPMTQFVFMELLAFALAAALWALTRAIYTGWKIALFVVRPALWRLSWRKISVVIAGLTLGALFGIAPVRFMSQILEKASPWIGPVAYVIQGNSHVTEILPPAFQRALSELAAIPRNIRSIDPAFGEQVAHVLSQNPQGELLLKGLRDRGGTVRLPRFFISKQQHSDKFYLPPFDAVFISPADIEEQGWTVEEFLANQDKQGRPIWDRFIWKNRRSLRHEIDHGLQYRHKIFFPGQLKDFPRHLLDYGNVDNEYEVYINDILYVHEELKANPHADVNLLHYEDFVESLDKFFREIKKRELYGIFAHLEPEYHHRHIEQIRKLWPELSVEGFLLLAERYRITEPARSQIYLEKAFARAKELGLPQPALASLGHGVIGPAAAD